MDKPKYPIESVDNALRLLLRFKEGDGLGVSDAGELLGVAPSTAHRLLSMLQYRGFAVQDDDTRTYHVGPALIEIGLKAIRDMSLRSAARPALENVSALLDETVHLLVREGTDVRFVDGVESSRTLRVTSRIGLVLPAHCTAGGKVLLADLDPKTLRSLYPASRLPGLTPRSLVRRSDLEKELALIRERGYALNVGESEDDVTAVASAVRDGQGRVRAAIAVAVPSSRTKGDRPAQLAEAVTAAAVEVRAQLE